MKSKIVIGIIILIVLICAGYFETLPKSITSQKSENVSQIGNIEYKGKILIPVENFKIVTSKYGARIHPITRKK